MVRETPFVGDSFAIRADPMPIPFGCQPFRNTLRQMENDLLSGFFGTLKEIIQNLEIHAAFFEASGNVVEYRVQPATRVQITLTAQLVFAQLHEQAIPEGGCSPKT